MLICQHWKSRSRKHGAVTQSEGSPYTPGGLRFAASAYGIRAHRGMPPPLHAKTIVTTAPHPSALRAATFPQGKASLRWVGTLLRCPTVPPPSHASVAHLPLHAGKLTLCRFCIWNSSASGHAAAPTEFAGDACGIGFSHTPSTLTGGLREKFRERGKIEVEFMGVLCYDNAVSIWACCALK